jgi:hypothetical protein
MYFCPSREIKIKLADGSPYQQGGFYIKSNLSAKGKSYLRKPSLGYLGDGYYTHLITSVAELDSRSSNHALRPVLADEWTIEEIT